MSTTLKAYSIRESLQGSLQDFVRESGFASTHTEELAREMVSLLATYREEDFPLFPEIFIFATPQGLTALSPALRIKIGSATLGANAARKILKDCATLATRGWAVYVVNRATSFECEYGIFRSKRHSFALPAEESLCDLGRSEPALMVRNRGHLTVELINGLNEVFTASLTTNKAEPSQLGDATAALAAEIASQVADPLSFKPYLKRLLTETIQRCHGTLIAVIEAPNEGAGIHSSLEDGIRLEPPLDLAKAHSSATATSTADALADLQAAEIVFDGMINSDGLVVFDNRGRIVAYRVFLRARDEERAQLPDAGGGRRRIFELMRLRLGSPFLASLIRSQDGHTQCERRPQ